MVFFIRWRTLTLTVVCKTDFFVFLFCNGDLMVVAGRDGAGGVRGPVNSAVPGVPQRSSARQ